MAENGMTAAEEKATRAAEDLAAEGLTVTAAAVRERSGVRMATAAAAAKAWKERVDQGENDVAEPVPEKLQERFSASLKMMWREARAQSRVEFDEARTGWETKLAVADSEVAKLTAVVEELETEHETAVTQTTARIAELEAALDEARAAQAAAEDRAVTADGISAGLREALSALKPMTD